MGTGVVRKYRRFSAALAGAVAAAVPIVAKAGYSQAYTVDVADIAEGTAVLGSLVGGVQGDNNGHSQATLWDLSTSSSVTLTPSGWTQSILSGMTPTQQVGYVASAALPNGQAILWNGSSTNFTMLHSAAFDTSRALGIAGNQQVGYGTTGGTTHAILWFGSATNYVDLNPAGSSSSQAAGTTGSQQVGYATFGGHANALLWNGSSSSFTNLHPAGYSDSAAMGISGAQTVGYATFNGSQHAGLWNGTTFTDLNVSGADSSVANATNGSVQVGEATFGGNEHAIVWNGIGFQNTDLNQLIPGSVMGVTSIANAVDAYGDVSGTVVTPPPQSLLFPTVSSVVWYVGDLYRGGGKLWDDSTAWITNSSPTSGDLLITPTTSSAMLLQYPNHTLTFGNLWVDTPGSGTMQLAISVGSLTTAADLIGYVGHGVITQTGGSHTAGTLELGSQASGVGTYSLSGAAALNTSVEHIGNSGTGIFTQTGGSNTTSGLQLAVNPGSSGSYNLSGGTLTVNGTESVGLQGNGSFTQSAGSNTATTLNIASFNASSGTVTLSATGSFHVTDASVGGTAIFTGGVAKLELTGGTFTATGSTRIGNASSSIHVAGGSFNVQSLANAGTYIQTGGVATMTALSGAGTTSVGAGKSTALLTVSSFNQSSVSVAAGGTMRVASSTTVATNVATSLSITGGSLDLNYQHLLTSTSATLIRQDLINGYANGNWNGTGGINSTWAANDATKRTGLGYAPQTNGATLVAATLYGDTTLKGSVGLADYNTLASNFNKPGEWAQGDFNYDGTVGLTDYNLLAANFNKSAQPGGGVAAAGAAAPAAVKLSGGSASPAASTLPQGVVDPGAGKVALEADPSTGKLYIVGHDSNINSYEVDSAAGKLTFVSQKNSGGYNTLTAQSATVAIPGSNNPAEDSWAIISSQAGTFVAEAYPASDNPAYDIIGPGLQVFDLNKSGLTAWTAGTPISDLSFKYGNGTGATLMPAVADIHTPLGPEPTCLALAGIAAGGLLSRKRRKA